MKTLIPQVQTALNNDYGLEYSILLEVDWNDSSTILYADKKINDEEYPYPWLISVEGLNAVLTVDNITESQTLTVTLSDIENILKTIFDNNDINHRDVRIYLLFDGHPLDYKIQLYQGEINSPIVWDEGTRTLTFTVLTRLDDIDVGFSMEEGDFPEIPEEALGKVWPLVFGTVCNMQTVQVTSPRRGLILLGEGIADFTLEHRICQARKMLCPEVTTGTTTLATPYPDPIRWTDVPFSEADQWSEDPYNPGFYRPNSWNDTAEIASYGIDTECVEYRFNELCNLLYQQEQQESFQSDTITIYGGENFPQGEYVTIYAEGAKLRGTFSGNIFTILDREHPDYAEWEHQLCEDVALYEYKLVPVTGTLPYQGGWEKLTYTINSASLYTEEQIAFIREAGYTLIDIEASAYKWTGADETIEDCPTSDAVARQGVDGVTESRRLYNEMEAAGFHWMASGTEIYLADESEVIYIVSLIPGTINSVAAYKTTNTGRKVLMEVPPEYYTIYDIDYEGYEVIELGFTKKLSLIDSDWTDDIYVSFTSDVGPNPVDIIEWLLDKYTDVTPDVTTFTAVKTALTNYPCNFSLKTRKNVFELIKDIAYQSRCAVYIRDNIMYIKYLSIEPTSVKTITEDDIIAETLSVNLTNSDDLNTKHIITWKKHEAGVRDDTPIENKIILKHNIRKYGIQDVTYDYYTQNTYSTILKSATFWMIRESNSWKNIKFSTTLHHLDLDLYDCITLSTPVFNGKGIVQSITFDPDNNQLDFELWTPIKAGTTSEYIWAWPANQNQLERFPAEEDEQYAGSGYDFVVRPPEDHILRSGYVVGNTVIYTSGDQYPSDLDDTFPTITCEISDVIDFEIEDPEFAEFERLEATVYEFRKRTASNTWSKEQQIDAGGLLPEEPNNPEEKEGLGCLYTVAVQYIVPESVKLCTGGPCKSEAGMKGKYPCAGQLYKTTYTFSSAFSACNFYNQKNAEYFATQDSCDAFEVGVPQIYGTPSHPAGHPDPSGKGAPCYDCPGHPDEANHGQVYQPKDDYYD